jgi:hypothetical protein
MKTGFIYGTELSETGMFMPIAEPEGSEYTAHQEYKYGKQYYFLLGHALLI